LENHMGSPIICIDHSPEKQICTAYNIKPYHCHRLFNVLSAIE
jgi:hypothetical protein